MFNELKTAQASAYLLHKAGGTMHHIKLMKLLYLADRLSWKERDCAITGDEYYSLPYGPVLSRTLNLIRGETLSRTPTIWEEWISDKENHQISIAKPVDETDEYFWGELSLSDTEILDEIFTQYGHLDRFKLVELTHDPRFIPEWQDPHGGARRISLETLLKAVGKSMEEINTIFESLKFNFELERMIKHVESETISIPQYDNPKDLEKWLMAQ